MKTRFLAPLLMIVVALAAVFVGGDGHIGQRAEAATATAVGIDLETSDNTPTSMGTISTCRSVSAGAFFDVDIYVTGVSGGIQGLDATLEFYAGAVRIPSDGEGGALDSNLLLAQIPGSSVNDDLSDARGVSITSDGIWAVRAYDVSGPTTAENGDGVLTRITFKAVTNGKSALQLAIPGIGPMLTGGDSNPIGPHTDGVFTGTVTGAQIYVGSACPGTNNAPSATTTTAFAFEDIPVPITLQGSDPEGICPLSFAITSATTNGALGSLSTPTCSGGNASATIYYAPGANVCTPTGDSFQYTVTDGPLTSSPTTVTVTIICQNDAPSVSATSASTPEDTPVAIPLTATDIDNDCGLTFSAATTPGKGSLGSFSTTGCTPDTPVTGTSTSTGQVTYTPSPDSFGADLFQYKATDASDNSAPAIVSIDVAAVADPPQADDKTATTDWNTPVVITLTASDVDGDCPLTFSVVSGPSGGTLGTISPTCTPSLPSAASATVTYSPGPTLAGSDSFTYKVTDPGLNDSNVATVDITVNQTDNDADGLLDHLEALPSNNCAPFGLAADGDGDGLTDGQEVILLGTDCDQADTDGDSYSDSLEMTLTGTATGASSTTLSDSDSSYPQPPASPTSTWAAGQWDGFFVTITGGTGAGQIRHITNNTATALAIDPAVPWTTVPDFTSTYAIHKVQTLPLVGCAADTVADNEDPDPQPADINDDRSVNIMDTFKFFPAWLTTFGDPGYNTRLDLNADGGVNILDVFELFPVWLTTCTP